MTPSRKSDTEPAELLVGVDYWAINSDDGELCLTEIDRSDTDEVSFKVLTLDGTLTVFMSFAAATEIASQISKAVGS